MFLKNNQKKKSIQSEEHKLEIVYSTSDVTLCHCFRSLLFLANSSIFGTTIVFSVTKNRLLYQSIPAGNIPQATPWDSHILLALSPRVLPIKFCPRIRSHLIFPEINKNVPCIFIFSRCYQEAIKDGSINTRFCLQ